MNTNYILYFIGQLFLILLSCKLFTDVSISWFVVFLPIFVPIILLIVLMYAAHLQHKYKNSDKKGN